MQLGLSRVADGVYHLSLDPRHEYLFDSSRIDAIAAALGEVKPDAEIKVTVAGHSVETPADYLKRVQEENRRAAELEISEDPNVQALQDKLGATLVKESIKVREQTR